MLFTTVTGLLLTVPGDNLLHTQIIWISLTCVQWLGYESEGGGFLGWLWMVKCTVWHPHFCHKFFSQRWEILELNTHTHVYFDILGRSLTFDVLECKCSNLNSILTHTFTSISSEEVLTFDVLKCKCSNLFGMWYKGEIETLYFFWYFMKGEEKERIVIVWYIVEMTSFH